MKFRLNTDKLGDALLQVRGQHVRVGILDKNKRAMAPRKPLERGQLMPGVPINKGSTAGRSKQAKLAQVMDWLNTQRGILDKALEQAGQKEVEEMADLFVKLVLSPGSDGLAVQKLENVAKAIIRNPIIRKEYGPNAEATVAKKEFDQYGVNTGTLMKSIEAKYGSD